MSLLLAAFIPALSACSSTEEIDGDDDKPIVSPSEQPMEFRGLDVTSRTTDLESVYDNFCVRAVKVYPDATKSLVIPDYIVKKINGEWIYSGLTGTDGSAQYVKYWDLSATSYTFAAVTPSSATGSTYSIDDDGNISISLADLTTDWMIARTIRRGINDTAHLLDYDDIAEDIEEIDNSAVKTSSVFATPLSSFAKVPLNFHPILAKVVIKVFAESETTLMPLEVGFNNIDVAPATFSSTAGWTATSLDYQELYKHSTIISSTQNSRETARLLTEFFVIPQQRTDASSNTLVEIKVKTNHNDAQMRTFALPTPWEPNKTYIYYLKFEGGVTDEVILFDVEVDPFIKDSEAEDEQTNW